MRLRPFFGCFELVEQLGIAPSIPVWKVIADGVQRVSLKTYARDEIGVP